MCHKQEPYNKGNTQLQCHNKNSLTDVGDITKPANRISDNCIDYASDSHVYEYANRPIYDELINVVFDSPIIQQVAGFVSIVEMSGEIMRSKCLFCNYKWFR